MPSVPNEIPVDFMPCDAPAHWANRVSQALNQSAALAIGVFSTAGELKWSNWGMQVALRVGSGHGPPRDYFVHPTFQQLAAMQESEGVSLKG